MKLMAKTSHRKHVRVSSYIGLGLLVLFALGVVAFVVWAQNPMRTEAEPYHEVATNSHIQVTNTRTAIIMQPTEGEPAAGLLFYPGARVEPAAYAYKFALLVERTHITVVIAKPLLGFALFDQRNPATFTGQISGIDTWYVGGHSLGGVRACQVAPDFHGLILFGSYCANNLSTSSLPVLSIGGGQDGLSTPAKIEANRRLLPASASMKQINGLNHAGFGNYGPQPGDNAAMLSSEAARLEITTLIEEFIAQNL